MINAIRDFIEANRMLSAVIVIIVSCGVMLIALHLRSEPSPTTTISPSQQAYNDCVTSMGNASKNEIELKCGIDKLNADTKARLNKLPH